MHLFLVSLTSCNQDVATLFPAMFPLRIIRKVAAQSHTSIRAFSLEPTRSDLKSLHNKNFLSISQLSYELSPQFISDSRKITNHIFTSQKELLALLSKAQELKNLYGHPINKKNASKPLENDICSMIFQKRSTRTRWALISQQHVWCILNRMAPLAFRAKLECIYLAEKLFFCLLMTYNSAWMRRSR